MWVNVSHTKSTRALPFLLTIRLSALYSVDSAVIHLWGKTILLFSLTGTFLLFQRKLYPCSANDNL